MYLTALRPIRLSFELAEVIAVQPTPRSGCPDPSPPDGLTVIIVTGWIGAVWGPYFMKPHTAPIQPAEPGGQ